MAYRPDVTVVITVDELGDATATQSGPACADGERIVDRSEAWALLATMATAAGGPLLVRTVDERGRAYRNVVNPTTTSPLIQPAVTNERPEPEHAPLCPDTEQPIPAGEEEQDVHDRAGDPQSVDESGYDDAAPRVGASAPNAARVQGDDGSDGNGWSPAWGADRQADDAAAPVTEGRGGVRAGDGRYPAGRGVTPVVACAMGVLLVCLLTLQATGGDTSRGATTASLAEIGRTAIGSLQPVWSVGIAAGTKPLIADAGRSVAVQTSDGNVRLVDARTGTQRWSSAQEPTSALAVIGRAGRDVIAWHHRELIVMKGVGDAATVVDNIGPRAELSRAGGQLMVTDPEKPTEAGVLTDTGLKWVPVPDGATAMGAINGDVVASDGRPALHRTPIDSGLTERVTLIGPEGMTPRRFAGMAGHTVTVVWDEPGEPDPQRDVIVVVHDTADGQPLVSAKAAWADVEQAELVATIGDTPVMVGLGPVLLPVAAAFDPIVEADITWLRHVDERIWGRRRTGQVVTVDRHGTLRDSPQTPIPHAATACGALLVVDDERVHAIRRTDVVAHLGLNQNAEQKE
ncbi:hypothetical protein G1H11_21785 [Phytoactinopolyspora alkaliphila]|uniref:PQQ-binding-like beta-propeller repeat protein n=1 Tax=Phytoactinopolyspora alkaliphila TaxID=1783498 RepID=A0A6N9YSI2_9ACTN|nr:hypothetical protein [Phytoactinopolyspora alkaliphila]NED97934.1 hypothetical protein [Phytoactinopolyspora alkaliphila]